MQNCWGLNFWNYGWIYYVYRSNKIISHHLQNEYYVFDSLVGSLQWELWLISTVGLPQEWHESGSYSLSIYCLADEPNSDSVTPKMVKKY